MNDASRRDIRSGIRTGGALRVVEFVLVLASLAALAGCANRNAPTNATAHPASPSAAERLAGAPRWVTQGCRSHWKSEAARKKIVCGVGHAAPNRNRLAARDTAVARARSEIARSVTVTIENLVRLEDGRNSADDGELRSIVHQLTSASLPGCQIESVWESSTGEMHALVSLQVTKVQHSVRRSASLPPADRDALAHRAAEAFARLDEESAAQRNDNAERGDAPLPNDE